MLRRSSKLLASYLEDAFSHSASTLTQPCRSFAVKVLEEHRDKCDPDNSNVTKFELVNDPELWKYVERLIPQRVIPPCPKEPGLSGWTPPTLSKEQAKTLPYFVVRTRNHMLPVYLVTEIRGPRYITYVRKVQGDPWVLRNDVQAYLKHLFPDRTIVTKVNELTQTVGFKGKFVDEVTEYLLGKGF
ncbi:putative 39S ribosomal protein L49 [Tropilaelaps mercedesae]|uniref:Large ribosomal subunit protein mL49 n=1 Tax=Tropilaelaps mercedesae TaxID=418985 RepID=A0A1V9X7W1_9ACAR|nr:putative 39S ribosomal protein L49 [Tropilaelaps mercedesae]